MAKNTQLTQTQKPVPVQDLHLEESASIWSKIVERLIKGI